MLNNECCVCSSCLPMFLANCGFFGFGIGSFYNELTLAILYHVVDTCDGREHCFWEQNDSGMVQGVRFW